MAHAQKPDFIFRRNGRVHLNLWGRQFSPLLAAEVCVSAVVMVDTPCSEVVWRVLATHCIRQFPLHFPSRASPCAIIFQLESTEIRNEWSCTFTPPCTFMVWRLIRRCGISRATFGAWLILAQVMMRCSNCETFVTILAINQLNAQNFVL